MFLSSCYASEITGFAVSCDAYLQRLQGNYPGLPHISFKETCVIISDKKKKENCLHWDGIKSKFLKRQNTGYNSIKSLKDVAENRRIDRWRRGIVRDILALWITNAHHAALWIPQYLQIPCQWRAQHVGVCSVSLLYNWSLRKCIYNRSLSGLFFLILYMCDVFIYRTYSVLALS